VNRTDRERGAAVVELALVTPFLFLLLFGIIDFGRMLNAQITVTEAAREGARATALGHEPGPRVTAVTAGLGAIDVDELSSCDGTDTDAEVEVSHAFAPATPLGSIMSMFGSGEDGSVTITATGVMPCVG
jgi:Flp pilus assembly protein TadG